MTFLELFPRSAPAGIVAAELLRLGDDTLLGPWHRHELALSVAAERGRDRVRAGHGLVRVREASAERRRLLRRELGRGFWSELRQCSRSYWKPEAVRTNKA